MALVACDAPSAVVPLTAPPPTSEATAVAPATPPPVATLLKGVDETRLRTHVEALAAVGSRSPGRDGHVKAQAYIRDVLTAIGSPFVSRIPRTSGPEPQNWYAEFGPEGNSTIAPDIWITAHYDSIADRTPGWNAATDPAPGANDNGTGVAGLLEIARILQSEHAAGHLMKRVGVLFLDEEELGMRGSIAVARSIGPFYRPTVINLDMVGFSGAGKRKLDVVRYAGSGDLLDRARRANDSYGLGLELVDRLLPAELRTWVDSTPFAMAGAPAITLTESYGQPGVDYPGYPGFHRVDDTPDRINNVAQWKAATQLALAIALELAR